MASVPPARNAALGTSVLLVVGAVLLLVGTSLHPMHEDPNDPLRAFTEYAADGNWLFSHMVQLGGVAAMIAGLLLVLRPLATGKGQSWAALASAFGIASLAMSAALQAVDGIALKAVVDAWSRADAAAKQSLFHAAFAVRQVEIGVAAVSSLLLGATVLLASAALHSDGRFTRWLPIIGGIGGLGVLTGGVVLAQTGFSASAMAINMLSSMALLVWVVLVAIIDFRRAAAAAEG